MRTNRTPSVVLTILAVGVIFVAGAVIARWPGALPRDVAVYPQPGTDTAHPATTISVRGIGADPLGTVTVAGVVSGHHSGRLRRHRDGAGVTFVPDHQFVPGERVVVDADAPLGPNDRVTFEVGIPGEITTSSPAPGDTPPPPPEVTRFVTEPDIAAPVADVEGSKVDGVVLSTPGGTRSTERGAMITDGEGDLIWWYAPDDDRSVGNLFRTQLDGEPVLAWFEGHAPYTPGWWLGEWVLVDDAYEEVARISASNGYEADVHELEITDRGTALLVAYQPLVRDATARGGNNHTIVLDGVVQEIDIATGDVLFEWHSLDHVPLTWCVFNVPENNLFDYAHINAFAEGPSGDLLVTMRHTSMVTEVDRATGELNWVLGGPGATVQVSDGTGISHPHHARWDEDGRLSVFDNGVGSDPQVSRGVLYELEEKAKRARLTAEYGETPPVYTKTMGSVEHHGDLVVAGWGERGHATVFGKGGGTPLGRVRVHAPSYRIHVAEWTAQPAQPPETRVARGRVYASWNGATDVTAWELQLSTGSESLGPPTIVESEGFETALPIIDDSARRAVVRALDSSGAVLAVTDPFPLAEQP